MNEVPTVALANGVAMPALGLGTSPMGDEETEATVAAAIGAGYRLIDTAENYGNERGVGRGIRASGVDRDEVFVTTKFNERWHGDRGGAAGVREQRGAPRPRPHRSAPDPLAQPEEGSLRGRVARARQAARGRQGPRDRGLQLQARPPRPAARGDRRGPAREPDAARPEDHSGGGAALPRRARHRDRELVADRRGRRPARRRDDRRRRATRTARRPAQIVLRWHVQLGLIPIPKTSKPERLAENIDVFDFELSSGRDGRSSPRSIATAREPWTPTASATEGDAGAERRRDA